MVNHIHAIENHLHGPLIAHVANDELCIFCEILRDFAFGMYLERKVVKYADVVSFRQQCIHQV